MLLAYVDSFRDGEEERGGRLKRRVLVMFQSLSIDIENHLGREKRTFPQTFLSLVDVSSIVQLLACGVKDGQTVSDLEDVLLQSCQWIHHGED